MKHTYLFRNALFLFSFLAAVSLVGSCDSAAVSSTEKTTVSFSLTDAPIDSDSVKAVNITVSSVSVNESGSALDSASSWNEILLDPVLTVNLLDLQNGITEALGDIVLDGGTQINQIRLGVDSVSIIESDDSVHEAVIPSATGFKIVNAFQVPLSGIITIAIDFDVRKAIVSKGNGQYLVKPAVRAVLTNEAGKITGSVGATGAVAVYAYADGTFLESEAVVDSDGLSFQNSYSCTLVKADGSYVLAFMDAGIYDLYAVAADGSVVGTIADVVVASGSVTPSAVF